MSEYLIQGETLTGIADAIRAKTGSADQIAVTDMAAEIEAIRSGGSAPSVKQQDVNFYDYDGTLLYSYTVAEAQALTELPAGPEHEGLVFQKWNWNLENVKALTRKMNIGAQYTTDDGTTRLYIHLEEGRTSPMLGVCPNGTVTVDWGDGTTPDVLTGASTSTVQWTPNHEYAAPGDYVIRLTVDGSVGFSGVSSSHQCAYVLRYSNGYDERNRVYQNALQRVENGDGVTDIGSGAFYYCTSLSSITIPDGLTSIRNGAFENCTSLSSITIPDGVTSIGSSEFYKCYSLSSIAIPDGVTDIGSSAFYYCTSLSSITIPDGLTSIGSSAFYYCYSLPSITIPDGVTSIENNAFNRCYSLSSITIPDGVTSIGSSAFYYCYSLSSITIPDGVTSIGSSAFDNCASLSSITIPDGVTSIENNAFNGCYSLSSITIPDGVTSIKGSAFNNCYSLSSITIPDGVTSIGDSAFVGCYGVRFYDFSRHAAVLTLSSTNVFKILAVDCEIRVPAALYDEWIAATNWSAYADKIVPV